ncbi:MAG: pilus assembly protein PilY [Rhodoferax sp.]|nr:pilus assembly protein PilY [Rhodoferax sp.]
MKPTSHCLANCVRLWLPLLLAAPLGAHALPVITFAAYPLFLAPSVKPNVMLVFDNSESMDATMSGKVISGDDATTRGNIARGVLRDILGDYRNSFNWGLTTFATTGNTLYNTHAYYVGDAATMVYTNDCRAGVSASNGGLRCIANPEVATNGFAFITYKQSGDDADINDVLYSGSTLPVMYGIGDTGVKYFVRGGPRSVGTGWASADFPVAGPFGGGSIPFFPTDAGWLPQAATMPRQLWTRRGWGYGNDITGAGNIVETVQPDTTTHFDKLIALLGNETNTGTGEIKNSAFYTPLTGSLQTVRNYFNNTTSGKPTPITQTCQRNFVMMATDGNPTGKTNGTQYNPTEWVNTETPVGSGIWTYGQAQQDVFTQLTGLRSTAYNSKTYDIQTYVVGMGDTLANPSSVAALNKMASLGGGYNTAFLGSDVSALTLAFQSIVGDIQSKVSAASSVALNGGSWNTGSSLYQAKFSSADWSGNLLAFPVASDGSVGSTATWESAARVKLQNWDTQRNVLTYKPSAVAGAHGIPFRWPVNPAAPTATELDLAQVTALNLNATNVNDGFGIWRSKYLRGDGTKEPRNCSTPPCSAPQFRNRNATPLGDIVNSSPYYVGAPNFGYYDDMESAAYSAFASTYRTRTKVIYAGGNDGMMHGIDSATGNEIFGYIPSAVYASLTQLTDLNYSHRYLVDGSPTVGDVFYAGAWHSLLVSGMRTGAKGLFALDVTDPTRFTEANAGSIVRWEFTDPDMGYVFGQPLVVKTNNGRWSVVVSGGYNAGNATGHAFLFVIDAQTGVLVRKIDTGAGTALSPNGLSPAAAIDTNNDAVADIVYAGDLDGHLWKFDLSNAAPSSWGVGNAALPLFTTSAGQSITGRPDVTKVSSSGYDYLVTFGTGRYIDTADNNDPTAQTEYGIRDTNAGATVTVDQLQQQSIVEVVTKGTTLYRLSTHAVDPPSDALMTGDNALSRVAFLSTKKGWYMNLPSSGERAIGDPRFRGGRIIFTTIIPNVSDPCAFGGSSWLMELDAITGNRFDGPTFDTNGDGTITAADLVLGSTGNSSPSGQGGVDNGIWSTSSISGNTAGTKPVEDKYSNTSEGVVNHIRETAGKGGEGRAMWREVR